MVMFPKSMIQRINANAKSKQDHPGFKSYIMDDIGTKQWQNRNKQWQYSAMNGAGYRSRNPQCIPIYSFLHKRTKIAKSNIVAKFFYQRIPKIAPGWVY